MPFFHKPFIKYIAVTEFITMFLFCTFLNKVMPPILSVVYKMNEGRWEGERVPERIGNKQLVIHQLEM